MGCGDSTAHVQPKIQNRAPVQNFNNNSNTVFYQMQNMKRPRFLNPSLISPDQQSTLWKIIQQDSIKQFAYYLQTQKIPSNVQIGPSGMFWNFAHFCSRWNAFKCLQYIIKRVYSQNASSLLSLMNQQSIQKYTALHIAIQWNSLNCFYMLIDCGGIDLTYVDKDNNDVFAKANLFKRQQMLRVLQKFKKGDAMMIIVQRERVRGFKQFNQLVMSESNNQSLKQYKISEQRILQIIDTKNRLNKPPSFPAPIEVKKQDPYKNYYNAIKNIEQSKTTASETQINQQDVNRLKLEQQRKFQENQQKAKMAKAQNLRRQNQIQRQQQQKRLNEQITKQIEKQRIFQQSELAKLQIQKEQIKKNIQAMQSNKQKQFQGSRTKMQCPQDIKIYYQKALAKKTRFVDEQFPPELKSLGKTQNFKFGWENCVWLRPDQMFSGGAYEVFDGISPQDIKQGTLAVCYYLALLSSIAQNQQRIKKIFRFYDKQLGFYAIQLYMEGKPRTVIVDDLIPCLKGTNEPLFAKPASPEIWVMILQKAWVKLFGSYLAAQKMSTLDMFENVLPAPCRQILIDISKIDQCFNKLVEFDKLNYIMVASSRENQQIPPGIVQAHAYSLLGAYNINGVKICKVRNPWGKTEYQGMYSQSSTLWTNQLKEAVGFKAKDDGIFFLTPSQLQSLMPSITISYYKDSYDYSFIQLKSKSNQDLYFVINVKKKGEIAIKVTQQQEMFRKIQYQNSPIRIQLLKLEQNYNARIISEGEYSSMFHGAFNLYSAQDIYQNLDPGRYLIRLKVLYDRTHLRSTRGTMRKYIRGTDGKNVLIVRQGTCCLSIYAPQKYIFNNIGQQDALKYYKNAFKNYLTTSEKTSQRLRSVGADLKPTVIAKDCKLRNHIIYYAQNNLPNNSINFNFVFDSKKFRNCSYSYNADKDKQKCQWVIEPGKWNLATLQVDCPYQDIATQGQLKSQFKIIR